MFCDSYDTVTRDTRWVSALGLLGWHSSLGSSLQEKKTECTSNSKPASLPAVPEGTAKMSSVGSREGEQAEKEYVISPQQQQKLRKKFGVLYDPIKHQANAKGG